MGTRSDQFLSILFYICFVFYLYNKLLLLVCKLMILIYFFTSVQCLKHTHHCKNENICVFIKTLQWSAEFLLKGIGCQIFKRPKTCASWDSVSFSSWKYVHMSCLRTDNTEQLYDTDCPNTCLLY